MKSTQAMRDRIRELMNHEQDDYDRAVECVIDDLEAILTTPSQGDAGARERIANELWAKLCHECYSVEPNKCDCVNDIKAALTEYAQSAPAVNAPHNSGERLPSSNAAEVGADTPSDAGAREIGGVDVFALADCFDHDELRGRSPIREFTAVERRMIAAALRAHAHKSDAGALREALEAALPYLETLHSLLPLKTDARKSVFKIMKQARVALASPAPGNINNQQDKPK